MDESVGEKQSAGERNGRLKALIQVTTKSVRSRRHSEEFGWLALRQSDLETGQSEELGSLALRRSDLEAGQDRYALDDRMVSDITAPASSAHRDGTNADALGFK
jgi:hypothetical protein